MPLSIKPKSYHDTFFNSNGQSTSVTCKIPPLGYFTSTILPSKNVQGNCSKTVVNFTGNFCVSCSGSGGAEHIFDNKDKSVLILGDCFFPPWVSFGNKNCPRVILCEIDTVSRTPVEAFKTWISKANAPADGSVVLVALQGSLLSLEAAEYVTMLSNVFAELELFLGGIVPGNKYYFAPVFLPVSNDSGKYLGRKIEGAKAILGQLCEKISKGKELFKEMLQLGRNEATDNNAGVLAASLRVSGVNSLGLGRMRLGGKFSLLPVDLAEPDGVVKSLPTCWALIDRLNNAGRVLGKHGYDFPGQLCITAGFYRGGVLQLTPETVDVLSAVLYDNSKSFILISDSTSRALATPIGQSHYLGKAEVIKPHRHPLGTLSISKLHVTLSSKPKGQIVIVNALGNSLLRAQEGKFSSLTLGGRKLFSEKVRGATVDEL